MYISFLKKEMENKEFLVLFWFQIKGLHFDTQPHGEMLKKIWSFGFNKVNSEAWHSTPLIQLNLSVNK